MRPRGIVEALLELDNSLQQVEFGNSRLPDCTFCQLVEIVVMARVAGRNCAGPMCFLMQDCGFFPKGSLRIKSHNRADGFVKGLRKSFCSVGLNGSSTGWYPGCQRPNLQPDLGTNVLGSESCRVANVDGMRVAFVNAGGNARNQCKYLIQLAKQGSPNVFRGLGIHLLVVAGLFCFGDGDLVGIISLLCAIAQDTPIKNQVDVLRETVNQPVDLREAGAALKDRLIF